MLFIWPEVSNVPSRMVGAGLHLMVQADQEVWTPSSGDRPVVGSIGTGVFDPAADLRRHAVVVADPLDAQFANLVIRM